MEVHAITKNIRMSAQKMREVVRQVQGMPAAQAQAVLAVVPRKGARFVAKTLKSAIANAEDIKTHRNSSANDAPRTARYATCSRRNSKPPRCRRFGSSAPPAAAASRS